MVTAMMALPPNQGEHLGKTLFRLLDLQGRVLGEFPGRIEVFEPEGNFQRAVCQWPGDLAPAGGYQLLGLLYDRTGNELGRVAPRMVSVNMTPGY